MRAANQETAQNDRAVPVLMDLSKQKSSFSLQPVSTRCFVRYSLTGLDSLPFDEISKNLTIGASFPIVPRQAKYIPQQSNPTMHSDILSLSVATLGLLVAGIIKGATGLGYASCALPFLAMAMGLRQANSVVMLPALASNFLIICITPHRTRNAASVLAALYCGDPGYHGRHISPCFVRSKNPDDWLGIFDPGIFRLLDSATIIAGSKEI